ncbi:long-chain fatty acid--CoA ligase [Myxococcota bacterium]|nr:long-chain fatty acid--CoA ligase [Myxococcota bacterium]MBU1535276.1 long-chain fatty acid--CoA ligase [Myxococcota bacterium]
MFTYEKPDNLVSSFENTRKTHPKNPFIGKKDPTGEYRWETYDELGKRIDNLRAGLAGLGVVPEDTVGIISNNRSEWLITALAAYGRRASFVPMYELELEKLWHYIIKDARVKILIVSTKAIFEIVSPFLITVETLERIFVIDDDSPDSLAELEREGAKTPVPSLTPHPQEIASIVYTSGTTGDPKGVMLSHGNITSNSRAGWHLYPFLGPDSASISILPWAHSYGMTAELFCFMQFGGRIGIMESVATLGQDIETIRPTIIIGVPRVFNKIYEGLIKKMQDRGGMGKTLFFWGIENGIRCRTLKEGGRTPMLCALNHKMADAIVFSKVRKKFGGNVKACLTASAAIKPEVIEFFMALGLPLYEAYGLTETSPALAMNSPENYRIGSVGKPLEFVEIKIDKSVIDGNGEDGEILARGPNVMKGYLNKPEETAKVITVDGWVRTGDRGYLDEDNFLFITGRIKEQYKLVNGKYVFPASIEEAITHNPYITNAFVYGSGCNYNVALVVPDFETLAPLAIKKNISTVPQEMITHESIRSFLLRQIKKDLEGEFGHYEIPQKIVLAAEPFTMENGILTQTMKTKRRVILERYGKSILNLYED